jgi:magnesium transporter
MNENVVTIHTLLDQEQVALEFSKYDYTIIPVVDNESRLVGIITIDDVVDIIEEEATEDMEIMAAMAPSEKPYLKTSIFEIYVYSNT